MLRLFCKLQALRATRDKGATAAEYALIIALVAVVVAVTVTLFGNAIREEFRQACTTVGGGASCGTAP